MVRHNEEKDLLLVESDNKEELKKYININEKKGYRRNGGIGFDPKEDYPYNVVMIKD